MAEIYQKPPLTFQEQLDQIIDRGLVVNNKTSALQTLQSISYYRLSAYWYLFRIKDEEGNLTDLFSAGTTFESVIELYEFDRRLRLLILDAIERIEVAIRTRITYYFSHTYGPFAHTDPTHFHPKFNHANWISKLKSTSKNLISRKRHQHKSTGYVVDFCQSRGFSRCP